MKQLYEKICRAEILITKILFVFLAALVFAAAFSRTIGYPINWSVDMAVCLFAWCTFLGASISMRKNRLMKLEFFINKAPQKLRFLAELFNLVVMALFLLALIGFGIWLTYTTRFRTFQGIPGFSYSWVTISVPVGSLMMLVTALLQIRDVWRRGPTSADKIDSL